MTSNGQRYRKQELFAGLGPDGQAALRKSRILVAGAGATGGTVASLLVRAGVGLVRIVDRDFLELSNLNRQILYDESDLETGLPKAVLAERKLKAMNRDVEIEGIVTELNPQNAIELMSDVDLILDGLDNQVTRYLINDVAVSLDIPWIWTGCLGSIGNVMTVVPGKTPCLRCILPDPAPPGAMPTCDTAGIIGPTPNFVASLAAAQAMKLLSGTGRRTLHRCFTFDLWEGSFRVTDLQSALNHTCICCHQGVFEFLGGRGWSSTESMCGIDAVQVRPPETRGLNLEQVAQRLDPESIISANAHLIRFRAERYEFSVFPDGRVIIHGTDEHSLARALYDRYVGS
ncbi:MAG: ThiF family adenylyltransferase [Deltaproteobacteria bacterium]|nr:ThiF family adenylyltransferase [Deltaproteobacteria bacterium]